MVAIEDMDREAAHQLMRRLKLHAIDAAFYYTHRYRPGDLLMWDNTATMHFAMPIGAPTGTTTGGCCTAIVPLGLPRRARRVSSLSPPRRLASGSAAS